MSGFGLERWISENGLVFSSMEFLFCYFPLFIGLFFLTPVRFRYITLFIGSILLYTGCEPFYVLLLLAVTALNYLIGRYLVPDENEAYAAYTGRRKWLIMIVAVNVGILLFFKVGNVVNQNLLLPLGISFYSFKMLSYQFDVYRGKIAAETNFMRLGAYFCSFFQITSGPVMRYEESAQGLNGRKISFAEIEEGIRLLVLGLASKILLADQLGFIWNDIQTVGFESISTPLAWFGAFAYSLQLYFDFQGYSLMAVGIGIMMGFPYIKNFNQPYMAASVSGFWRRWHITLGTWFRDYVYIPLGGNRESLPKTIRNLAVVWVLTGLWHGGSVNFLLWGLSVGVFVIAEKLFYGKWISKHRILSHLYVWSVIPLTWVIFAIEDIGMLGVYFGRLFPFFQIGNTLNQRDIFLYFETYGILMILAVVCCIPCLAEFYEKWKKKWIVNFILMILFWISVYKIANMTNNPFMYFRF